MADDQALGGGLADEHRLGDERDARAAPSHILPPSKEHARPLHALVWVRRRVRARVRVRVRVSHLRHADLRPPHRAGCAGGGRRAARLLRDMWGDIGEIYGDVRRCREMQGDIGRSRKM